LGRVSKRKVPRLKVGFDTLENLLGREVRMWFLTGSETQLLSVAVGAVIALAGSGVTQWRQGKGSAAAMRVRAIEETLTAADDLLAGVRLFRNIRGRMSFFRALAAGVKVAHERSPSSHEVISSMAFRQQLAYGAMETILSVAPGGMMEAAIDKDASYFQSLVMSHRIRLSTAVSSLRTGSDKALAEAADLLIRAGGELADEASAWPWKFRKCERLFERRVQNFRAVANKKH